MDIKLNRQRRLTPADKLAIAREYNEADTNGKRIYTTKQVAQRHGISQSYLFRLIKKLGADTGEDAA